MITREVNRKVPAIRFKGFSEEWVTKKLKEVADSFEYGLNAAAKKYDGKNQYLRITDIDDLSREFKKGNITSPDIDIDSANSYRLIKGDILFARTGASVGKTYIHKERESHTYFAGFLIRARINKSFSPNYIFQNTLTAPYKKYIQITSQRSGQPGVNAHEYASYKLALPDVKEQNKIGNLFKDLDSLISKHQQKHDKLNNIKRSLLEKMFPQNGEVIPAIRFKVFSEEWEKKPLGEVANGYDNQRVPVTAKDRAPGDTPYYGANGIQDYVDGYTHDGDFILIAEDGANDLKNYPVKYVEGQVWVNNHAHVLQAKEKLARTLYLKFVISQTDIEPFLVGGGRAKLNAGTMMKIEVKLPKRLEEQTKIGNLFQKIDTLVTQHQTQITKLNNIKQSLLNKMFV